MKHKVSYNDLQVGDILILLDNQHAEKLVGDVVAKEENNAGKLVRVRVGQNLPTTIYVEDFLEKEGHPVFNSYIIERVVGNMRVIEKGDKSVSVPKTMFGIKRKRGMCRNVFKCLWHARASRESTAQITRLRKSRHAGSL